jgi:peptidoglycan/xylan/chitin deacetylase (PgdA/CDA1 family)
MTKPMAALSLDLDNKWSYMKTHGDAGWEDFPSYLDILIPQALEFCARLGLKMTFFIVGQDAALDKNRAALAEITRSGHDVGNHSHRHEPWLHLFPRDKIREEILLAEKAIEEATGRKPAGFRGPGFSWSEDLILVLKELGYAYDASTFPTWIGPFSRLYYFWTSDLTPEEKKDRKKLFGGFRDALLPVRPYSWTFPNGERLLEIPVTTMPFFRAPIHFSYLLYLARYSKALMLAYIEAAASLCRLTGTGLSFLLHPLDFLDTEEVPGLAFFPGMDIMKERKRTTLSRVMLILTRKFRLVPMNVYAESLKTGTGRGGLRSIGAKGA